MIKIETNVVKEEEPISDILMEYEVNDAGIGEYLSILDKIKKEILENSNMSEETLKEILFGKED